VPRYGRIVPVMNLPPREIVPPVITNAWLCYVPAFARLSAWTK
jgi:hypothetical protein